MRGRWLILLIFIPYFPLHDAQKFPFDESQCATYESCFWYKGEGFQFHGDQGKRTINESLLIGISSSDTPWLDEEWLVQSLMQMKVRTNNLTTVTFGPDLTIVYDLNVGSPQVTVSFRGRTATSVAIVQDESGDAVFVSSSTTLPSSGPGSIADYLMEQKLPPLVNGKNASGFEEFRKRLIEKSPTCNKLLVKDVCEENDAHCSKLRFSTYHVICTADLYELREDGFHARDAIECAYGKWRTLPERNPLAGRGVICSSEKLQNPEDATRTTTTASSSATKATPNESTASAITTTVSTIVSTTETSTTKKPEMRAKEDHLLLIVGSIVGSVVLIILLGLIALFLRQRCRRLARKRDIERFKNGSKEFKGVALESQSSDLARSTTAFNEPKEPDESIKVKYGESAEEAKTMKDSVIGGRTGWNLSTKKSGSESERNTRSNNILNRRIDKSILTEDITSTRKY